MNKSSVPTTELRNGVQQTYSEIAVTPAADHPIPVGRDFAARLGYSEEWLNRYPLAAEAFAGVAYLPGFAAIPAGITVLDLGCGAGFDSLITAEQVGPQGQVIGIDFSEAMLARATQAAGDSAIHNVQFRHGSAEQIPLDDASVDIVTINGIFNLNPARARIFPELVRVLRPEGVLFAAEMILRESLPPEEQTTTNWYA
jgi:SAM-dependent methyltransferase